MQYAAGKVIQGKKWRKTMSGMGDRWVEPFAGGLGAYQQIAPSYGRALISDLSPVILMWEAVRNGWRPDVSTPLTKESHAVYKQIAFGDDPTPQAVYAVHTGSFRGSATGSWSPSGPRRGSNSGLARLEAVADVLRSVPTEIRQCDYKDTLSDCGQGDVVYLDPPYSALNYWIRPPLCSGFDVNEMLNMAEAAVLRGAVVFISHYNNELDTNKWRAVELHLDQSPMFDGQNLSAKRINEYLYVDIRTFYRFDFRGDDSRVKTNRRAAQTSVRQDLLALTGGRCEATGELYPKYQLDLVHGPGFEFVKMGDSDPDYCYLVNKLFHAALDAPESGVTMLDGMWVVPECFRDQEWAKNTHGMRAKRCRK